MRSCCIHLLLIRPCIVKLSIGLDLDGHPAGGHHVCRPEIHPPRQHQASRRTRSIVRSSVCSPWRRTRVLSSPEISLSSFLPALLITSSIPAHPSSRFAESDVSVKPSLTIARMSPHSKRSVLEAKSSSSKIPSGRFETEHCSTPPVESRPSPRRLHSVRSRSFPADPCCRG